MINSNESQTGLEIAIIGMAGVFPKSENIRQFWENLVQGKELIDWTSNKDHEDRQVPKERYLNKDYVSVSRDLPNKEYFDSLFFKYQPSEAEIMDPQIRVFHEVVWTALEDAGIVPEPKNAIGLYAGASDNLLWKSYNTFKKGDGMVDPFLANLLCDKDRLSTLISYKLNLNGPSIFLRTACSTSLVAVHMACRALLTGECDVAIAGGVSISSNATPGYNYRENMIFSPDGHTRTFDEKSNGTIFSDGAGAVVLKRLSKARKDGDNIYAVIKGSAINNDGNNKIGFTAPSIEGQMDCIKMAHKVSKVLPETIDFVEAHGTATNLGDPIEVEALNKSFESKNKKCFIGSVKSNIGHSGAAAGIAGLIKTVMALKHKMIPPTINYTSPNPKVPFEQGPFIVANKPIPLTHSSENLTRAAVSSFGIGGTNAHVIVEEVHSPEIDSIENEEPLVFQASAKKLESLKSYLQNLKTFIDKEQSINLKNLCYTLQEGRKQFDYRLSIVAANKEELIKGIVNNIEDIGRIKSVGENYRKVVLMFPGQGVQYSKMCRGLYQTNITFRKEMDKGFLKLEQFSGIDFKDLLFESEEKINDTKYTQPLLFIVQYSIYKLLSSVGFTPEYMIGHSFGEYTAACISGVMNYEDTLRILTKRGELMHKLPEGRMLGVSLGADKIKKYLGPNISLASINSPGQCILSGEKKAIESLIITLEEEEIKHKLLHISFASHSNMIDLIIDEYKSFLNQFEFKKPKIPFVSNLTGKLIKSNPIESQYWCEHLRNTVDFSSGIKELDKMGDLVFVDIGPGDSLLRLFKQNKAPESRNEVVHVVKGKNEETIFNDNYFFISGIGKLWEKNVPVDWSKLYDFDDCRKLSLPTYCFHRQKYPTFINLDLILDSMGAMNQSPIQDKITQVLGENTNMEMTEISKDSLIDELKEIWKVFFGLNDIELYRDFFEYGGDSLKAMSMIKILNKRYHTSIPIKVFFKNPTVVGLAKEIKNNSWLTGHDKNYENKITI